MKIFTGWFGHEGNTMTHGFTEYERVVQTGMYPRGQEAIDKSAGKPDFLGGVVDFCLEHGVEMVCSVSREVASPPFSRPCLDIIISEILEDLEGCKDEIDGICFVLHGAGCADGIDDLESYMLEKFRAVVGDEMPITVPLDLHGNISHRMAELADGLFGCKQYPHTDQQVAGRNAMSALYDAIAQKKKMHTAVVRLPILVPAAAGYTYEEPFVSLNQHLADYVKSHGLLDATFFHGFPYADTSCSSASVVVVGYEGAEAAAEELADYVWSRRSELAAEIRRPEEALQMALAYEGKGYVLLNEASDNPGGGAPGDGTWLLREMLRQDIPGSAFCFIYDPEAAAQIAAAGPGGRVSLSLGGKIEKMHGDPIELRDAYVVALSDGRTVSNSPMTMDIVRDFGLSARIRVGNVDVIVASAQKQSLDDRLFLALGIDLSEYRIAAIKSTHHFRAYFRDHAAAIIPVETPGVHCADLSLFTYRRVSRPILPLDPPEAVENRPWH